MKAGHGSVSTHGLPAHTHTHTHTHTHNHTQSHTKAGNTEATADTNPARLRVRSKEARRVCEYHEHLGVKLCDRISVCSRTRMPRECRHSHSSQREGRGMLSGS